MPKRKEIARGEAVMMILRECASHRRSQTAADRTARACEALSLSANEMREIFGYLEYCDYDGKPFGGLRLPFGIISQLP